jgi:hypothetical protein
MTIKKVKTPKIHPKIVNEWMIFEGMTDINSVFGALLTLKSFINSPEYSKQGATWAIESIQSTLCNGTQLIEQWCEIEQSEDV